MATNTTEFARLGRAFAAPGQIGGDAASTGLTLDKELISAITNDAFTNALARTGFGTPSLLEGTEYPLTRLTRNYVLMQSLYRSHWIVRQIISAVPEDMLKSWVELSCQSTPEQLDQFDKCVQKTHTPAKLLAALKWGRLFGGAGAVIVIKGHEKILDQPLVIEDVPLDSYRGLLVFDRWSGISPNSQLNTDIDNPVDFGLPVSYLCTTETGQTFNVHGSRVLRFCGRDLPQWEWQAEWRWGLSEIEAIYDELRKRDNTSWSAANLMFRANIMSMKMKDVGQMLATNNAQSTQRLANVLGAQNKMMSNQGLLLTDSESGGLESHQYSFGGVSDLLQTQMMDLAGAAEIPVSRLFGRTISGLSQSNEGDERTYYDSIHQKRESKLRPQLTKLFPVICMSTWGEVPDDFDFKFKPLHSPTDKERSELAQQYSSSVVSVFNTGLVSQQIALKELRQTSDVTGLWTNITDEDIEAADDTIQIPNEISGDGAEVMPESVDVGTVTADSGPAFAGVPVVIEYSRGQRRIIRNDAGNVVYERVMRFDYGYIPGTVGRDGDDVDVIVGPDADAPFVFVADMRDLGPDIDKRQDEDKVLLGFRTAEAARDAFYSMYPETFLRGVRTMTIENFRKSITKE